MWIDNNRKLYTSLETKEIAFILAERMLQNICGYLWIGQSVSLGTDPPSKPNSSNFFCPPGTENLNKSLQADKKSWQFQSFEHV